MTDAHMKTKVVVRNLPYNLTGEEFKEATKDSWPAITWHWYTQGHKTTGAEVIRFHDAFDGHTFLDNRGREHKCSVEYAPYQKVPRKAPKKDRHEGEIETDEDYQKFLLELNQPAQYLPSAEVQYEERIIAEKAKTDPSSTPILDELRQRAAGGSVSSKRERGRGKRQATKRDNRPPQQPQQQQQQRQVTQIVTGADRQKEKPGPPQAPSDSTKSTGGGRGRGGRGGKRGGEGRGGGRGGRGKQTNTANTK